MTLRLSERRRRERLSAEHFARAVAVIAAKPWLPLEYLPIESSSVPETVVDEASGKRWLAIDGRALWWSLPGAAMALQAMRASK